MKDKEEFYHILTELDGQESREYGRVIGDFDFGRFVLKVNRAPADSDSTISLFIVRVPQMTAGFPHQLYHTPVRRTALEDYLTRRMAALLEQHARFDDEGVARRRVSIAAPGQKILPRTSLIVSEEFVEARLYIHLPTYNGRILGDAAKDIFFDEIPAAVNAALVYCNLDTEDVEEFINVMEDADQVRQALPTRGLTTFVREGSLVARRGLSDLPDFTHAAGVQIPDDLRIEIVTPNSGSVRGMGIPGGITVIVGDDYSGRIELMRAIAAGIYNHIPGDGREMVVTVLDAVYVSAESRRSVQRVDISPFVRPMGGGQDYTTPAAPPTAAQAASVVEALEVGARALLFDESDSAPGFLAQDARLAELGGKGANNVTPLSSRARQMADELGVSIIVGGFAAVADFVAVADTVLCMESFTLTNVTKEAKALALKHSSAPAGQLAGLVDKVRWVVPSSIDPSAGRHDAEIEAKSLLHLQFGRSTIDLSGVTQLADTYQTATIGLILYYAKLRYMEEGRPIREILDLVDRDLSTEGLEIMSRELRGDLARPRRYEIAAALNRLPSLRISHTAEVVAAAARIKLVIQRVRRARVTVDGSEIASIGPGALVLCGVARGDTTHDAAWLARKTSQLRIFDDEQGKLNNPISASNGSFLVVSQFTLYGDCVKGNRPSYVEAAPPDEGASGYEEYVGQLRALGHEVKTGRYRAMMMVELENDGPVTLILESRGRTGA